MERLFVIDAADYDENWPRSIRPTVRAIVERDGKLGMIYKVKGNYYAFPGGGIWLERESRILEIIIAKKNK